MSKIHVIYWSGTGNTQTMAENIALGINEGGGISEVAEVSSVTTDILNDVNVFALGCPSMGAEELEYDSMEPFVSELEGKVPGKHILLFGSYDWGDGEWMRSWESRCQDDGANLICDSVICNESPDDDILSACRALGASLT